VAAVALSLIGCVLLAVATFVPVMRWSVNEAHETAGDAKIWFGDGWTLADGGFEGAWLLRPASAAVLLLAGALLGTRGRVGRRLHLALIAVVAYVPLWTAIAFARKWEDQVDPDIGAGMLAAGTVALAVGAGLSWPTRRGSSAGEDRS
jgi:hypothetical protein